VISGSGFSVGADSYLRSNSFRNRLQATLQLAISNRVVQLPEIDISFLGDGILAAVKDMIAQSRVVDDALLLGLDIDTVDVTGERLTTTGDVDQLADFARNNDIAAVTSAVAVPVLLQQVQSQVSDQVAQNGATLEKLHITAQTGRFHIESRARDGDGTANFSFNLIPTLYASRPGAAFYHYLDSRDAIVHPRTWPALGFTTTDIQVDVNMPLFVTICAVIDGVISPLIPIIYFRMISEAAQHLNADIASARTGVAVPRVQRLKPSKPGGPTVRVEIADFEITALGTYVGIAVQPQAPPGALIGLTSIPSNFRAQRLGYTVRLPLGVQSDDPKLRIRWTVLDTSGTVLVNEDGFAAGRETFTVVPRSVGPGLSELVVGVRVYRALGAYITDFLNDNITLNIRGPLPPGAYVRWYYGIENLQVAFDDQRQTWDFRGKALVNRHSNLHRTDQPCANASHRTAYLDWSRFQTFDTLPFPLAEIALHRSELCDYCFYGGPAGIRPSL
jgi:hypothetical protein